MMISSKLSPSDWLGHIEQFQKSGLTRKAYCKQHSLVYHQFQYYYRHHYSKLPSTKQNKLTEATQTFVPIKMSSASSSSVKLELKFPSGIICALPLSINSNQLRSIVEVLRG